MSSAFDMLFRWISCCLAKYAYCWNYFGGAATIPSAGTFTINWNASGIFAITCT